MKGGEDPWATLGRYPELLIEYDELPPAVGGARWCGRTITLDERLGRIARDCALDRERARAGRPAGPHPRICLPY